MARNTFIFAIGGTGARVVRSLTMLLASGMKLNDNDKVIPIIIDLDTENEDTARTIKALDLYKVIRDTAYGNNAVVKDGFFAGNLAKLNSLRTETTGEVKESFQLKFAGINDTFEKYLRTGELDASVDLPLLRLLYDDSDRSNPNTELKLELTKGFKGNPNIGSVIFTDLQSTPEFEFFKNAITEGDRIFIISSIFGGTGSSGFPQLLKLIRTSNNNKLKNAVIGAITVMPYFSVQDKKESAIDSSRFMSKTKAALSYYEHEMESMKLNALYYIADAHRGNPYENNEGGAAQKNDAHLVEMIAATAAVHFINRPTGDFRDTTEYFEFGVKQDQPVLSIGHFFDESRRQVMEPLTRFKYFSKLYLEYLPEHLKTTFSKSCNLPEEFNSHPYYQALRSFFEKHFMEWLQELKRNSRSFAPFNLGGNFNTLIEGKPIKTGIFNKGLSEGYFETALDKSENALRTTVADNRARFMQVLYETASKAYNEELESLPSIA
jgi:Tubulin like